MILLALLAMLPVGGWAETWKDSYGNTWEYEVNNQEAAIYGYEEDAFHSANLAIPEKLGGCPVVEIDAATFNYPFLSVTIPATVRKIGNKAFQYSVDRVVCKGETPAELGRNVFYNNGDNLADNFFIYVPKNAVASYRTAWSAYASYIKESPAGTAFLDGDCQYRINDDCATVTLVKPASDFTSFDFSNVYCPALDRYVNISAIAGNAFAGNTTVTRVFLRSSVTSIGDNAFANSNVSEVFVEGDTPAEMGENVFEGVNNLKIYAPDEKVEEYKSKWQDCAEYITQKPIGETFTFSGCEYTIETYDYYDSFAKLSKCNGKESVIDFDKLSYFEYDGRIWNVRDVAAEAFKGNTFVERVIFPGNHSVNIGESAFADCSKLSAVICQCDYYDNVLEGQNVFSGCADNLVIYVPQDYVENYKTANRWSAYADRIQASKSGTQFEEGDFRFLINNDLSTVTVIGYSGSASDVTVPASATYEGVAYTATSIGELNTTWNVFYYNENIESLSFPASITTIGRNVIRGLGNLQKVFFLSKAPVYIHSWNFDDCGKYSFYVPQGTVKAYEEKNGWGHFKEDLRGVDCQVGNLVYHVNNDFTLTLKEYKGTDETMGVIAKEVKVDGDVYTVTSIADNVFANKSFIKTFVVMGDVITAMNGQNVFAGCAEDMVIYVLPSMVDAYKAAEGWSAYADHIQSSGAGKEFTSGKYTYVLNEDLQSVGVSRYDCSEKNVTLEIPSQFTDSESGVTYPVTTIKSNAFGGDYVNRIETVVIPASVTLVERDGFEGCNNLVIVQLLGGSTSVEDNAFGNNMRWSERYVCVPEDAYDYYRSTSDGSWSSYRDKIVVLGESMELTDATALPSKRYMFKSGTLTYRRSVAQAGQYATLVLPFRINLSDVSGLETAYVFWDTMIHYLNSTANNNEGVEKFILMLEKAKGNVSAGQPLIVKLSAGSSEISITNTENAVLEPDAYMPQYMMNVMDWDGKSGVMEHNDTYRFMRTGTYTKIDASQQPGTVYSFNPDGTFGPQTSGVINPFRVYLRCDISNTSYARYSISIGVNDGEATGVRELVTTPERRNPGAVYDINGRLVNMNGTTEGLSKGIYIVGGRKVVVNR